jgi:hypothetical protein
VDLVQIVPRLTAKEEQLNHNLGSGKMINKKLD